MENAEYVSIPKAAEMLRVSRATVWGWVKKHKLPAVRVGRNYRVKVDNLNAMIRKEA